jgi:hypothetical protein
VLLEVGEVFVTTNNIVHWNTLGHRKEIEVLRIPDVRLGFYGNIGKEAYVIDHFEEIVACLSGDKLVELCAGYDAADFVEFLLADIDLHVVAAQHVSKG